MGRIVSLIRENVVKEIDQNFSKYIFDGKEKRYRPARFFLGLFSKKILDKEFAKIFLDTSKVEDLLDVGGGTGLLADVLLKYSLKVYALEASIKMLEETHPRVSGNPDYFRINADIFNHPFRPDKTFDAIFCSDVIHHTGRHDELFATLKRCVKDGGRIIVIDYLPDKIKTKGIQLFEELFIEDLHLIAPLDLKRYFPSNEFICEHHPISRFEYIFIAQKKKNKEFCS